MKTTDALKLTSKILDAVVEAVTACGKDGAPASAVFIGLEAQGCTMEQFAQVVSTLVQAGRIRRDGDTLFAVEPASHTPGPWTVRGARIYGPPDEHSRHAGQAVLLGGVVDERTGWDSSFGHEPGTIDRKVVDATAQANVRLMAAAPELLKALEALLGRPGQDDHRHGCPSCGCDFDDERRTRARQAVSLAKGGSR